LAGDAEALELSDREPATQSLDVTPGAGGGLSDEHDQCDDESAKDGKPTAKLRIMEVKR
jgi:hypothetical protein